MIQNFLTSICICILPLCLKLYQKIWNAFHEWFKLSLCSQRAGLYIELSQKTRTFWGLRPFLIAIYRVHQCLRIIWILFPRMGKRLPYCCCWKNNFPTAFLEGIWPYIISILFMKNSQDHNFVFLRTKSLSIISSSLKPIALNSWKGLPCFWRIAKWTRNFLAWNYGK